jgi:hypothetical protein
MDVIVAAEECVQPGLEPIAVAVAPGGEFAARDIALLENEGALARVGEEFRGREARWSRADDEDVGFGGSDQRTNSCGCATVGVSRGIKPAMMISS